MKLGKIIDEENRLVALYLAAKKGGKKVTLPIAALLFMAIGLHFIFASHAATPSLSAQPENGTMSGSAVAVNDSAASGGKAVQFAGVTPTPSPTPSPTPTPPPPTSCTGPTVNVTGTTSSKYTNANPASGTTFNNKGWFSNFVSGPGSSEAYDVGMGNVPPSICVVGGVVDGHISPSLAWQYVHDSIGGFGYRVGTSGLEQILNVRVHDVEDGIKPRECATTKDSCPTTYTNKGNMLISGAYMTDIRDDSIEDDDFLAGTIKDSLFDGVWTFLSEQQQGSVTGPGVGSGESPYIFITNDYIRLYTTNTPETGGGKWFKWQGSTSHHIPVITDSVFAVDKMPRSGWSSLSIPSGTQWKGTNYILWLGTPGGYGGPKPAGVTFLEGQAALDKWNAVRNPWLAAHGYAQKAPTDLNPADDPVVAPQ